MVIYMPTRRCMSRRGKFKSNFERRKNIMKHGPVYTCRRMRLLSYLKEHGRLPFETIPDVRNPLFNVWRFHNDEELEQLIDDYFEQIKTNK